MTLTINVVGDVGAVHRTHQHHPELDRRVQLLAPPEGKQETVGSECNLSGSEPREEPDLDPNLGKNRIQISGKPDLNLRENWIRTLGEKTGSGSKPWGKPDPDTTLHKMDHGIQLLAPPESKQETVGSGFKLFGSEPRETPDPNLGKNWIRILLPAYSRRY